MFELQFRVDYLDTDAMGIVHHSRYCRWLERARVEWLREVGLEYKKLEEQGVALPLTRLELGYHKPLRFDDRCRVAVELAKLDGARLVLSYKIYLENGDVPTTSVQTEHVYMKQGKVQKVPQEWSELLWLQPNEAK